MGSLGLSVFSPMVNSCLAKALIQAAQGFCHLAIEVSQCLSTSREWVVDKLMTHALVDAALVLASAHYSLLSGRRG